MSIRQFTLISCAIGVALAACEAPSKIIDPPVLQSNILTIHADSTVLWNGAKVDSSGLRRVCRRVARKKPQPEIHLVPDRMAKYDAVAVILSKMQRDGCVNIGFTGIDTGR